MEQHDKQRTTDVIVLERIERDIGSLKNDLQQRSKESEEIRRALEDDRFSGDPGVFSRIRDLERDVSDLKRNREITAAERAGMKKLLNIIGATSLFTVISLIGLIVTIVQGLG